MLILKIFTYDNSRQKANFADVWNDGVLPVMLAHTLLRPRLDVLLYTIFSISVQIWYHSLSAVALQH